MYLINRHTKKKEKAEILPVTLVELKSIDKSGLFGFTWVAEKKNEVYKIQLESTNEIVGLVSLVNIPDEIRIHINLLESSNSNVGEDKKYEGIAGCLIAFACRQAFLRGYSGFVSLLPKTKLIGHYIDKYNFEQKGRQLCVYSEKSRELIRTYIEGQ